MNVVRTIESFIIFLYFLKNMQNDYIACAIPYTRWFIEHQVILHCVKDRAYLPILMPHSSSSGETSKDRMKEATRTENAKQ